MRKITMAVGALLTLSAMQTVQAGTFVTEWGNSTSANAKETSVTIVKDKESVTTPLTLNNGKYTLSVPAGYSIAVKLNEANGTVSVSANEATLDIKANGMEVKVTVTAAGAVTADTDVKIVCAVDEEDFQKPKTDYTTKVAVVINKANQYTNDARLQQDAVAASKLMADVMNITFDQYDEWASTGKIEDIDKELTALETAITNHKALYDGYVYAHGVYGNEYKDGVWTKKEDLTGTICGAFKEVEDAYQKLADEVKQNPEILDIYEDAKKRTKDFYDNFTKYYFEYEDGTEIDGNYTDKQKIDEKAESLITVLIGATDAITVGFNNVSFYYIVVQAIEDKRNAYNIVVDSLYTCLSGHQGDGAIYNDMYLKALNELNVYLRIIKNVEDANKLAFDGGDYSSETQANLLQQLAEVTEGDSNIYTIYNTYKDKADQLRAKYAAACNDIQDNLQTLLDKINTSVTGKTEVSEYYEESINGIQTTINDLQNAVDAANEKHEIGDEEPYSGYNDAKDKIIAAINALSSKVEKSVAEYDAWQDALSARANVEESFDTAKKVVQAKKSDDGKYEQAETFKRSEEEIQASIDEITRKANEAFKADGTGSSVASLDDIIKELKGSENSILVAINEYALLSETTMSKYETIAKSITENTDALEALKAAAGNTSVTIDATESDELSDNTYQSKINDYTAQIKKLQTDLDAAIALTDDDHFTAMEALAAVDFVGEIDSLINNYQDNLLAWSKIQVSIAKKSMLEEANRRVTSIQEELIVENDKYVNDGYNCDILGASENKSSFETDTYGKRAEELNTRLLNCTDSVTLIKNKIAEAEVSDNDAAAIALLTTVNEELRGIESTYTILSKDAENVKSAYTDEKKLRKELLELIKSSDVSLNKVYFEVEGYEGNYFATELNSVVNDIDALKQEIADNFEAETLYDSNTDGKFHTEVAAISTKVTNLTGLVSNEQQNKDFYEQFNKEYEEAKISDALDAVDFKYTTVDGEINTLTSADASYDYFANKLQTFKDTDEKLRKDLTAYYEARAKALDSDGNLLAGALDEAKYTDTQKNLSTHYPTLKTQLQVLSDNIKAFPGSIEANEQAKANQDIDAGIIDALRTKVFQTISNAETSSYHVDALDSLMALDKEIAIYKGKIDSCYAVGASATNNSEISALYTIIYTRLYTLDINWEDNYKQAVKKDNVDRLDAIKAAYKDVVTLYGEKVTLIAKMSKLSYADGKNAILSEVTGDGGIYDYAERIRVRMAKAQNEFDETCETYETDEVALFDPSETHKAEFILMQEEIQNLADKYTNEINSIALQTYNDSLAAAEKKYTDAKEEIVERLGVDTIASEKAICDVRSIIDEIQGSITENGPVSNFAIILDETILPALNNVDTMIVTDKENAAIGSYNSRYQEYLALSTEESDSIAKYHNGEGTMGYYSEEYTNFLNSSICAAATAWENIEDGKKYNKYADVRDAFGEFSGALSTREQVDDDAVYAKAHTEIFWKAYEADKEFHANDVAYEAMKTAIKLAQEALHDAENFVNTLYVKNDADLSSQMSVQQVNINGLRKSAYNYHNDNAAKANLSSVELKCDSIKMNAEAIKKQAIDDKEYLALQVQINALKHDYNQAAAIILNGEDNVVDIDNYKAIISGYTAKNESIYSDFHTGKKDADGNIQTDENGNFVTATLEETQAAFIALEKEIGATKSKLTAIYSKTAAADAKAAVQAEIDKLNETYKAFVEQLEECHEPVRTKYHYKVEAFKAAIDALQAELDTEDEENTVLLYQDVNIKTAGDIAKTVETLADDIKEKEQKYITNDRVYNELTEQLNALVENFEDIRTSSENYDFKNEPYRSNQIANIESQIADNKDALEKEYKQYNLTEASALLVAADNIQNLMDNRAIRFAYYNVYMTLLQSDTINVAKGEIAKRGYTPADKELLESTVDSLIIARDNAMTFNNNVYGSNKDFDTPKAGFSSTDINGDPSNLYYKYMDQYEELIAKAQEIRDKVNQLYKDIVEKSWIKGDVDHNDKVTVADYDAVRQMVLGLIDYQETDAIFYAADVNEDGLVNIGDVNQIGSYIIEGTEFTTLNRATTYARSKAVGAESYGDMLLTAEGMGLEQTVKVAIDSRLTFTGAQFDVVLPAGIRLVSVASASHDAMANEVNGAIRVLVSDIENAEIVNGETFVELNVEVSSEYNGGNIEVRQALFADAEGTVFSLAKASLPTPTAVTNLTTVEKVQSKIYSVGGQMLNAVKKGINIIVNSDGTTRKQVKE